MKHQRILKYIISLLVFALPLLNVAQTSQDTLVYKERYGLRIGIDVSKPVRAFFDDDYTGLEVVGDIRISKRFYLAGELGTEQKTTQEDLFNFTSKGSYFKVGLDYNTYENWYGMENSIYTGLRISASTFSQELNSYSFFTDTPYWQEPQEAGNNPDLLREFKNLNALWAEAVFGLKAEMFNNLYFGASIRLHYLISDKASNKFPNLWIPGFNKVTLSNNFGVSFNYTVSYFIPLYKKEKN